MRIAWLAVVWMTSCSVTLEFDALHEGSSSTELEPGSVGSGFTPNWKHLPITEIVGGFIDGRELVVAVREHGNSNDGGLLAIDLDTGARRLAAGRLVDASGASWDVGNGPWLHELAAARRFDDGSWAVLLWSGFELRAHLLGVDPESGTRTTGTLLGVDCDRLDVHASGALPLIGKNREVWLPYTSIGAGGVLRITETECEPIELGLEQANVIAGGDDSLFAFDASSGAVAVIDALGESVAFLPSAARAGVRGAVLDSGALWTVSGEQRPSYERMPLAPGEKLELAVQGPAASRPERPPNLWLDGARLLIELDGAIVVVSTETGDSRVLSY